MDEDFVPGVRPVESVHAAIREHVTCVDGKEEDVCTPLDALEADDNCNGIDEDCDGFGTTFLEWSGDDDAESVNVLRKGRLSVQRRSWSIAADPRVSADDASGAARVDDDCDGLIDEDYLRSPLSCGLGVCARASE